MGKKALGKSDAAGRGFVLRRLRIKVERPPVIALYHGQLKISLKEQA